MHPLHCLLKVSSDGQDPLQVRRIRYPVVEDEEADSRPTDDPTCSYAEGWDPERWDNVGWDIVQPSGRVVRTDSSMSEAPAAPSKESPSERVSFVLCALRCASNSLPENLILKSACCVNFQFAHHFVKKCEVLKCLMCLL